MIIDAGRAAKVSNYKEINNISYSRNLWYLQYKDLFMIIMDNLIKIQHK